MKAETIVKLIERAREPMLKEAHIKAYAETMIKQDRERVKEAITITYWQKKELEETPIILE